MTRQAFGGTVVLVIAMQLSLGASLQAQAPLLSGATAALQTPPKSTAVTVTMTECEGINDCATWTFLGAQGNGKWPSGEEANLAVEKYDATSVVIRRADSTGASAGLTAVYSGTRHGDRVGGDFTSSWPGHWDNKTGNWYATVGSPVVRPEVMHFCDVNCFTLHWEDGQYVGANHNEIWTVESFTHESVILRRKCLNPAFTVVYHGQISAEGDRLINAANPFHAGDQPSNIKLAWGAALDSVPGNNEERDGLRNVGQGRVVVPVVVTPVVCVPWFFTVICAQ